jgi:excinuclease ABC subunit C
VSKLLEAKLGKLPTTPGVYFHKNSSGKIIYIGKAANLRNRVRQYFQKSRLRDPKTDALVAEIADLEWREVDTELDALFLEAELIRRYMPQYNILLRDDKSLIYVRIDIKSAHPTLTFTRRPLDDGAEYLGPYFSRLSVAQALKYLRRAFPYSTHTPTNIPKRACLQAQIGLCPGLEADMTSLNDYRKNLKRLMKYLRGGRKKLIAELEKEMKTYSKAAEFEKAAAVRNKLNAVKGLDRQVVFGNREAIDISKDHGLVRLGEILNIDPPRRIEGFDISHMSGTDNVASMVVFVSGLPDKSQYRKFKMRIKGNDDFEHMREVMTRRFSEKNIKLWGKPDLILIDGGKGQVSAALSILNALSIDIPMIGLAKRYEEIIIPRSVENATKSQFEVLIQPTSSDEVKLLQRIRDESHRFAVSYHSTLKRTRQTASALDDIPTIGPNTRKKLIKTFGSMRGVMQARDWELEKVIGAKKAAILKQYLRPIKKEQKIYNKEKI